MKKFTPAKRTSAISSPCFSSNDSMSSCRIAYSPSRGRASRSDSVRLEAVMRNLRLDRVGVGREGRIFHQDLVTRLRRPIKGRHQQVQVDRQAVHADDFVRLRADQPRRRFAQGLVIGIPGRRGIEVPVHARAAPSRPAPARRFAASLSASGLTNCRQSK